MTIKARARSALIIAAGLLVSFVVPPPAMAASADADNAAVSKSESATSGKSARQGSRYLKKRYAHRKYTRTASKSSESRKADEKQVADASGGTPALPEWLANANAQMTAADAPPDSAAYPPGSAPTNRWSAGRRPQPDSHRRTSPPRRAGRRRAPRRLGRPRIRPVCLTNTARSSHTQTSRDCAAPAVRAAWSGPAVRTPPRIGYSPS